MTATSQNVGIHTTMLSVLSEFFLYVDMGNKSGNSLYCCMS